MVVVRIAGFVVALGLASLLPAQLQPANFDIRFEPTAKLQTGAPIPFRITIHDDLGKPVPRGETTLRIETPDHAQNMVFKASEVDPGVYIAKPQFPHSGQWNVTVHIRRNERESARTISYTVPD